MFFLQNYKILRLLLLKKLFHLLKGLEHFKGDFFSEVRNLRSTEILPAAIATATISFFNKFLHRNSFFCFHFHYIDSAWK